MGSILFLRDAAKNVGCFITRKWGVACCKSARLLGCRADAEASQLTGTMAHRQQNLPAKKAASQKRNAAAADRRQPADKENLGAAGQAPTVKPAKHGAGQSKRHAPMKLSAAAAPGSKCAAEAAAAQEQQQPKRRRSARLGPAPAAAPRPALVDVDISSCMQSRCVHAFLHASLADCTVL